MKRRIIAADENMRKKVWISRNLKIADKSMENAIRQILFDTENTINWDRAVKAFQLNMPELSTEYEIPDTITLDSSKCVNVAHIILDGVLSEDQLQRADEIALFDFYDEDSLAYELSQETSSMLYVMYGIENGRDYELTNNVIKIIDRTNPIWKQIELDLGQ